MKRRKGAEAKLCTQRSALNALHSTLCVLVPLCVEKFMGQADAAAKLAEFQRSASWQQSQLIEKGGWATATGSTDPNAAVARVCAQQLANRKT